MCIEKNEVHVIIAPSPWNEDPITYRRHRLANFINNQDKTKRVIWISPMNTEISSLFKDPEIRSLENGILQVTVNDWKSIVKHFPFFQKKLSNQIMKMKNEQVQFYLWYTYPAFAYLSTLPIWQTIIYDCSDHWEKSEKSDNLIMDRIKRKMIGETEKKIIHAANSCFASSIFLQKHLYESAKKQAILIENGVDLSYFDNKDINSNSYRGEMPVLGFVGGLKPWKIDFLLLLDMAKKKMDWKFILIGATYGKMNKAFEQLEKLPNVSVLEPVALADVSIYMKEFSIGIMPYLENEYNQGVFPLKFFEYLASGLPVVGCGLPSTEHYVETGIYEHVQNKTDIFINACEKVLNNQNTNASADRRKYVAKESGWDRKLHFIWNESRK